MTIKARVNLFYLLFYLGSFCFAMLSCLHCLHQTLVAQDCAARQGARADSLQQVVYKVSNRWMKADSTLRTDVPNYDMYGAGIKVTELDSANL